MGIEDIPKIVRAAEIAAEASKVRKATETAVLANKAVSVKHWGMKHPLVFPPGTDPAEAEEFTRRFMAAKAKGGVEHIDMPSELPAERRALLEAEKKKNEQLQAKIQDLESRRDLQKVSPGLYYDDQTEMYWRVTGEGRFEQAYVGKTGVDIADILGQEAINSGKELMPKTAREQVELDILQSTKDEGLTVDQALAHLAGSLESDVPRTVKRFEFEIRNTKDPERKAKLEADLIKYKKLKKVDITETQ